MHWSAALTILTASITGVLLASGLCSMVEAAILSMPLTRARILLEQKRHGAKDLMSIKENVHPAVAAIVILNNSINIVGAIFIGNQVTAIFGSAWLGVFSAVFTFLLILVAEIIPKTVGEVFNASIALASAKILRAVTFLMAPLIAVLNVFIFAIKRYRKRPKITEEEIKALIRFGKDVGTIEIDEENLINKVFKLNDLTARQMMKPIQDVYALSASDILGNVKDKIVNSAHSRIVVFDNTLGNIVGVCQQRALLREIANDNFGASVRSLMLRPVFVAEDTLADRLLEHFRDYHQHLFIVRDREDRNIGIVTMEDVLEELFGEIYDEKDTPPEKEKR